MTHVITSTPAWRADLAKSLYANKSKPESRYFQLATVSQEFTPRVRTVVFRGFIDQTDLLLAHTDSRSNKIEEITHQTSAQICWYFTASREQYRFSTEVSIIDSSNSDYQSLRQHHWHNLSESAKSAYFQETPGSIIPLSEDIPKGEKQAIETEDIPETFVLLAFEPSEVDHLQLKPTPHQRTKHVRLNNTQWQKTAIRP